MVYLRKKRGSYKGQVLTNVRYKLIDEREAGKGRIVSSNWDIIRPILLDAVVKNRKDNNLMITIRIQNRKYFKKTEE